MIYLDVDLNWSTKKEPGANQLISPPRRQRSRSSRAGWGRAALEPPQDQAGKVLALLKHPKGTTIAPPKLTPHQRQEALQRLASGEAQADISRTYTARDCTIGVMRAAKYVQGLTSRSLRLSPGRAA